MKYNYDDVYSINKIIDISVPLFKEYDCQKVSIFGSYAKQNASKYSDIDFLIEKKGKIETLLDLVKLADSLEMALGKKVDIVTSHEKNQDFIKQIKGDCIRIC